MNFCNEESLGFKGEVIFNENQFVIENEKQLVGIVGGGLALAGPMNFTISNNYVNMYSFGSEF